MNQQPAISQSQPPGASAALGAEMDRVEALIEAVLRHRDGKTLGQEGKNAVARAQAAVSEHRKAGAFDALRPALGQLPADLALNVLMIVAYALVRPSRAYRLQALTGQGAGEFVMTQGLLHELLMPDDRYEAELSRALSSTSALCASGLIRAEGEGPTRQLRPGFALARFVSGSEANLSPPDAVRLVYEPGQSLRPLFLEDRVLRRLDEIEALVRLVEEGDQPMAGPAILFAGGPGTGKTLAAFHMAARLGRPMYQVDLGRLVSKWQGETERNLTRVFDEMCGTTGCLLMDEADAMMGRRVEVKDSRDAQNNLTVSHVLSLMERHRGPIFMTTNLRGNLDDAYTRRVSALVEFFPPHEALRARIWDSALARSAPSMSGGARAELVGLAKPIRMSAAEIVSAAVMTAALARLVGAMPGPEELARGVMLEMSKSEITFARSDLGLLAAYWPEEAMV